MSKKWGRLLVSSLILAACTDPRISSSVSSLVSSSISSLSSASSSISEVVSSSSEISSVSSEISSSISSSSSSSSSSSTSVALTSLEKITLDLAAFNYTVGMALPSKGANGTSFTYTSMRPDILTNKGNIIDLPLGVPDQEFILKVKSTYGGINQTRDVIVTIPATLPNVVTSTRQVAFTNTSEEYLVLNKEAVNLYYVNDGTVPFMDVEEFMLMIDQALDTSILDFTVVDEVLTVAYTIEDVDFDGNPLTYTMSGEFNFALDTFTVNNFNFFEYYVASTETDYGDGLNYVDATYIDGQEVTIPLWQYRVDMIQHQGENLVPLAVLNLLINNSVYYDVYYNGDTLLGFDTFTYSEPAINNQLRTSSANTGKIESDMKQATYHYLALAFDFFYGLKEYRGVETYYDEVQKSADKILSGSDRDLYSTLFNFVYDLDELHSWHVSPGYYESTAYDLPLTSISQLGQESAAYYTGLWAVQDELEAKFGSTTAPSLRLIDSDKIAIIHFDEFTVDTPVEVNALLAGLPTTVESVILDLTYNGGGNVGAVFRLFGYMTEQAVQYSSKNPGDGSASTYYIESDYIAYDFNWFIETSSVTFSAANLMASMAKEQGIATVIGRDSSGGASSIGIFVTPDGTILMRSSNSVSSRVEYDENNQPVYISIEDGVTVDIPLDSLYSDAEIIAAVNQSLTPAA